MTSKCVTDCFLLSYSNHSQSLPQCMHFVPQPAVRKYSDCCWNIPRRTWLLPSPCWLQISPHPHSSPPNRCVWHHQSNHLPLPPTINSAHHWYGTLLDQTMPRWQEPVNQHKQLHLSHHFRLPSDLLIICCHGFFLSNTMTMSHASPQIHHSFIHCLTENETMHQSLKCNNST